MVNFSQELKGDLLAHGRFSLQKHLWLLWPFCSKSHWLKYRSKSKHAFSPRWFHPSRTTDYHNLSLSWKWPGHFASKHWLQSLFTVPCRRSGQMNFAQMHQGRALERQHRDVGDSPWKSYQCTTVWEAAEIQQSFGQGWNVHLFTVKLNWSKWLLRVYAFSLWKKQVLLQTADSQYFSLESFLGYPIERLERLVFEQSPTRAGLT